MFFIKSALEALEAPGRPFLHDVNPPFPDEIVRGRRNLFAMRSEHLAAPTAKLKTGGARRDRTDDLMLAKHALYQLSYGPIRAARRAGRSEW